MVPRRASIDVALALHVGEIEPIIVELIAANPDLRIIDISDPANPKLLVDWKISDKQILLPVTAEMAIAAAGSSSNQRLPTTVPGWRRSPPTSP